MSDDEHVTMCYERIDGGTHMELCVTAWGDTIEEAERSATVKMEQYRSKIE